MEKKIITSSKAELGVSRRDFFRVASVFGMSSSVMAATALGSFSLSQLAQAAQTNANTRFKKPAKHT